MKKTFSFIIAVVWGLLTLGLLSVWDKGAISIEVCLGLVVATGVIVVLIIGLIEGKNDL